MHGTQYEASADLALQGARAGSAPLQGLAPQVDWSTMRASDHFVQFYETDEALLDALSGFIGMALRSAEPAIVVATEAHRAGLEQRLHKAGLDMAAAQASGQYLVLDAAETLASFMTGDMPDAECFAEVLGGMLVAMARGRRVRIYGEMVALLWAQQNYAGAIRLEQLWNTLQANHAFSLFCGYPIHGFDGVELAGQLSDICAAHSYVIPVEDYTLLSSPEQRLRAILLLQQQARQAKAEALERQAAQSALQLLKDEREQELEDLRRLHELSLRLTSTLDVDTVLHEVLRAALAAQQTDLGLLSLGDPDRDGLQVRASSGFDDAFLSTIAWVESGSGACGTAYQQQERVVIEDVEASPLFEPFREAARAAGFRAVHSTPLITRAGSTIGVISTHFRQPHRPSPRAIHFMDLYARMAADFIESARLHQQLQRQLEEREQLLEREQQARAAAELASRMKDEFLATVSHELRTPLTTIMLWAQRLRNGRREEPTLSRGIEMIERSARTQAQIIEDILDVSRVITGKLHLTIESVDMVSVINAAIDSVQLAADAKNIQLGMTIDPSARRIAGDPGRLQQVFWNLLSNAIKFTPQGGHIDVQLERIDGAVQISVSDSGEGIDSSFLPFMFDRFRQGDGTGTRKHGGLGLGLAIVRHLVELHGGTVQASSPGLGAGSTFTVRLPLSPEAERRRRDDLPRARAVIYRAILHTLRDCVIDVC